MVDIGKISGGIGDVVMKSAGKAKKIAASAPSIVPGPAGTKKLAASLDAMAVQNKALASQNKNELLGLQKLREKLVRQGFCNETLDTKTLRKIYAEADKLKGLGPEELAARGCSPTQLPEVSAGLKILPHPYVSSDSILKDSLRAELSAAGVHPVDYTQSEFDKLLKSVKKNTKKLDKEFKKAMKSGTTLPTEDPVSVAAREFAQIRNPKINPQAAKPEIGVLKEVVKTADVKITPSTAPANQTQSVKPSFSSDIGVLTPKFEPSSAPSATKITFSTDVPMPTGRIFSTEPPMPTAF